MSADNKVTSKTRSRLVAAVASLAIAGAVGLGAVSTGTVPVFADPVKLERPVQAPSFADVVDVVSPAVVSVRVSGDTPEPGNVATPFFDMPGFDNLPPNHPLRRFFDDLQRPRGEERRGPQRHRVRPIAQGSGFFISDDGYLVTNNHVVEGGNQYTVVMDDGTELQADLIGTDPRTDLAVLKVKGDREFTYVSFADDDAVRVGDWVVAVGNPFGLGGTVTAGIVSARGREIGAGNYDDFLQIDAAVNQGNSGGPTFNLSGQVVGVNTAIFSPSGGNVGIAFAIPASLAKTVVQDLIDDGAVERGYMGVSIQDVTPQIADSLGLEEAKGALVNSVNDGDPAAKAGIKAGDVVIAVDGKPIASPRELARTIASMDPGKDAAITVWRNGKSQDFEVALTEMPAPDQMASAAPGAPSDESGEPASFGLTVSPAEEGEGLVVTDVEPGSVAEDNGIQPGDVIRAVNSQAVNSAGDMKKAVDAASSAGRGAVLLQVVRDDANRFVALPIG
ncbi:Do family serine endopeptidase [Chelativorans sp. AA-79]|uniref:Do family serine endopeptidase n=1 Tax=Chelativorans sp. AA-79 TaxID=3028735 RepID=UPI0023F63B06|nr:Do family serine endopeptidase [Chelativorans sp. AA-79]WEX07718.1 Do family serine endopeptidase [Chelativorans sp. AA-79]